MTRYYRTSEYARLTGRPASSIRALARKHPTLCTETGGNPAAPRYLLPEDFFEKVSAATTRHPAHRADGMTPRSERSEKLRARRTR